MNNNTTGCCVPTPTKPCPDPTVWIIASIVLDGAVIATNIIEFRLLIGKWKKLDRIEHLLFSLCIADLLAGVSAFTQDTYQLKLFVELGCINMSANAARVMDCLFIFSVLVSIFHVTAIAVERLVAVYYPVKYTIFTTFKCKAITIVTVWMSSMVIAPAFTAMQWMTIDMPKLHYIRFAIFLTCTVVVFVAYMLLVLALVRREIMLKDMIPKEIRKYTRDRRTTVVCLLIGFSFVVCFLPYTLSAYDPQNLYHDVMNLLLTISHILNPLIYFAKTMNEARRSRSGSTGSILLSHSNGSNSNSK